MRFSVVGCVERAFLIRFHHDVPPLADEDLLSASLVAPLLMYEWANAPPAKLDSAGAGLRFMRERAEPIFRFASDASWIFCSAEIIASLPQSCAATLSASYSALRLIESCRRCAENRAATPPTIKARPSGATLPLSSSFDRFFFSPESSDRMRIRPIS